MWCVVHVYVCVNVWCICVIHVYVVYVVHVYAVHVCGMCVRVCTYEWYVEVKSQ